MPEKDNSKQNFLNEQTASIIEAIGDAVSIQSTDFKIVYQNNKHKELLGSHVGEYCYKAYRQRDENCEGCPLAISFERDAIFKVERKVAIGGRELYLEITASPLKGSEGKMVAGIEVVRDITERRHTEELLRQSEEQFRAMANAITDAVIHIGNNGEIIYWNSAAERMFGYKFDEVAGKDLYLLLAPKEHHETYQKGFDIFRKTGEGYAVGKTLEFKAVKKDGSELPVDVSFSVLRLNNEYHAVGTIRDITERKKAEIELQKVQKLESLGILAGGIAHDFNNILTAITGNVSLAKMYARPGLEIFDILTEVEKASLRAKNLTKQLLTFSKGGIPVKKVTDIAKIIKDTMEIEGVSSERCKLMIPSDAWPIEVDEGQVSSAISNLIINAQEAMPNGGEIVLRVENENIETKNHLPLEKGRYVKITVEDHGIGIPEENIHKIFDPYFTTKQEGSGLGLTTAYSIINKHSGHIEVESRIGAGTKFMIYLPASEEIAKPSKPHDKGDMPFTRKGRVLVMDDDEIVRIVVGRMIEQCGYGTAVATEGGEAIDIYKKAMEAGQPFDAVIIDLIISFGMGGKETIAKLLEIDPNVNAIVSSGYSDDPILANFKAYGFKDSLAKPYEITELKRVLHKVTQK